MISAAMQSNFRMIALPRCAMDESETRAYGPESSNRLARHGPSDIAASGLVRTNVENWKEAVCSWSKEDGHGYPTTHVMNPWVPSMTERDCPVLSCRVAHMSNPYRASPSRPARVLPSAR